MKAAGARLLAALDQAMQAWAPGLMRTLCREGHVVVADGEDDDVRLWLASELVAKDLDRAGWPKAAVGLPLGKLRDGRFIPSLEIATDPALEQSPRSIELTTDGGAAFLYGRIVEEALVRRWPATIDHEFVVRAGNDALGVGRIDALHGGRRVRPVRDLGWYLRQGG